MNHFTRFIKRKTPMNQTTGKQYMMSALRRKHLDRVPTTVLIGPYCSRLTSYSVREILTDARKSAEAHLAFHDRFNPDSLVVYNDIYLEAEAVGCELEFPEDRISHPKGPLLEDKTKLARLKVPDPLKDGRIPYFIEVCQRVSDHVRKTTAVGLGHSGPWNIAMHLRGAEALLMDTVTDPQFVHELMKFATEVVREVGDALIDAGFAPSLGEAGASCSLISPYIYQEFIKPYHKDLCSYFGSKKRFMSLHICGKIDPIMEDILETGIFLLSLDAGSSLQTLTRLANWSSWAMCRPPISAVEPVTKWKFPFAGALRRPPPIAAIFWRPVVKFHLTQPKIELTTFSNTAGNTAGSLLKKWVQRFKVHRFRVFGVIGSGFLACQIEGLTGRCLHCDQI
jgi:uroporphyrinogen decarboxylase